MKRSSKGFTLLELLIALVLSVIVLSGVYTTFDSIIRTKSATEESYYKNSLLLSARRVIKPDILQMHKDSLDIKNDSENDELTFVSNNSIKMEKAFPVTIKYYVDDGYLVREESSTMHSYDWKLYLMANVTKFDVQSHNGYKFTDDFDKLDTILKISFEVSGYPVTFIAGNGHLSKTSNYLGDIWQ